MDEVTDTFTMGTVDYSKILDKLIKDLYNIDTMIHINGTCSTANLLQEAGPCITPSSSSTSDWKANAVCDALVVQRACLHHAKGDCQFNHDVSKAVALHSDKMELSKIEAQLEQCEQVHCE